MLFFACQSRKIAPVGSCTTAIRPASITSNGGTITVPPARLDLRGRRVDVVDADVRVPVRRHAGRGLVAERRDRARRRDRLICAIE